MAAVVDLTPPDRGPEVAEHALAVVARRFALHYAGLARGIKPGQQHRRLHLRRGHRQAVVERQRVARADHGQRSEEHTSELQSLMRISYAVFCLKKKKQLQNTKCTENRIIPIHKTQPINSID